MHPGTEEISAHEWKASCIVASKYELSNIKEQIQQETLSKEKKLLLIIDGNSVMHRAFHVTPELVSHCGTPTGAIMGTVKMICNLVDGRKPTHLAVALDGAGTSFRKRLYPDYKANRKPKDPKLVIQLNLLPEVLKAINIRCLSIPGFEADDIIGTMAARAEDEGYKVLVLSGDGDMIQVVNENTTLLLTKKGVSELIEYTPTTTENLTGFRPSQITSFKALAGDSSDNIPGASGIGKVTARQLIKDYGLVENILSVVDYIPGKTGERLRASKEQIKLSLRLATIERNVPLKCSTHDCLLSPNLRLGNKKLEELGIVSINLGLLIRPREVTFDKKPEVSKVILRSTGGINYCGICGRFEKNCNKFVELVDGKISIFGQIFWACKICENELINPEFYRKIKEPMSFKQNGMGIVVKKNNIVLENNAGYEQPKLDF